MTADPTYDHIVIGAGPIGAATARHLAERGDSVLVIGPEEPAGFADHQGTWAGHYDQGRMCHVLEIPVVTGVLTTRSIRRFPELTRRTGVEFTTPPVTRPGSGSTATSWPPTPATWASTCTSSTRRAYVGGTPRCGSNRATWAWCNPAG